MKPQLLDGIAAVCSMAGQAISHLSRLAIPVLLFLLSAAMALCADPGSISGRVLTAAGKGAAVPSAPVEARNPETKATYKATTASDGSYQLSGLPVGAYEISVENVTLFLPFHQNGIQVVAAKATGWISDSRRSGHYPCAGARNSDIMLSRSFRSLCEAPTA